MDDGAIDLKRAAREAAYSMPIEQIDPADPELFRTDTHVALLRAPAEGGPGPLVAAADEDVGPLLVGHQVQRHHGRRHQPRGLLVRAGSITLPDPADDFTLPMFIAMDQPKHDVQRKTVSPVVSPHNLHPAGADHPRARRRRSSTACRSARQFDWVDKVSIELTTMMLATLFDFPWEDRRKLTRWSDVATAAPDSACSVHRSRDRRGAAPRRNCSSASTTSSGLWNERVNAPPQHDLISMLAHGESTRNMDRMEYLGNLILLIVGGNDTTRNTITGSVLALNQNPDQYDKLRANPEPDPDDGLRDHPLADAAGLHAPHGAAGRRAGRQDDQEGRQGRHVVRLGQPRRDGHRPDPTTTSSTANGRASTCRSASASTAAWATAWPSCSCGSSGKRSSSASRRSRSWARRAASPPRS